jgi:hypothetical protein
MGMPDLEDFFQKWARKKGLQSDGPRGALVHLLVSAPQRCPICALILERTFDDAAFLQSHAAHDPAIHEILCHDWIFCNNHAWLLQSMTSPTEGLRIYRGLLKGVLKNLSPEEQRTPTEVRPDPRPAASAPSTHQRYCPICEDLKLLQDLLVGVMITALTHEEFQQHYCRAAGLCLPHVQEVIPRVPGAFAEMVAKHFSSQLALLTKELSGQLKKLAERTHAWRDVESVCHLALERLVGARGISPTAHCAVLTFLSP